MPGNHLLTGLNSIDALPVNKHVKARSPLSGCFVSHRSVRQQRRHATPGYRGKHALHSAEFALSLRFALKALGKLRSDLEAQGIGHYDPNTLSTAICRLDAAQVKINLARNTFHISLQAQCVARRACPTTRKLLKKPAFIQSLHRLKAGAKVFIELVLPRLKGAGKFCHQITVPGIHVIEIAGIGTPKRQCPHARKPFNMIAIKALHMSCGRNTAIVAGKLLIPKRSATRGDD